MKIEMSGKRRRLLAEWLDRAVPISTMMSDTKRFQGMSPEDSKEVKETIDDIYTFCKKIPTGDNDNGHP